MSESAGLSRLLPKALKEISTAMKAIAFYPAHHPSVVSSLERAAASLNEALPGQENLKIGVAETAFLIGGEPLTVDDRGLAGFATYLSRRGVGALVLQAPVEQESLRGLLEVVAMDPATLRSLGGPSRCLSQRNLGGVGIEEFDPAALLKSTRTETTSHPAEGGESQPGATWSDLVARFLLGQQAKPPSGGVNLLRRVAGDEKAARELLASLQAATRSLGQERGSLLATALIRTASEVASAEPEMLGDLVGNLARALDELDPSAQIEVLQASLPVPGTDIDLGRQIRLRLPEEKIGEMIVSLVRSEGRFTRRLASVVRRVLIDARDPTQRREAVKEAVDSARRPGEEAMADVWESVSSLIEESEDTWISRDYKGFLELLGAEAPELDEATRRELEAAPGFQEALTPEGIRRRSWTLFSDLLEIESEPARLWVALDQIEKRAQALEPSWLDDCRDVVQSIRRLTDTTPPPRPLIAEASRKALAALGRGIVGAYRKQFHDLSTEQKQTVAATLGALGVPAVEPLIAGLSEEDDWEIRRTLIAFLVARGRAAVPALVGHLSNPSWYLVRNVLVILGDIADPSTVQAIAGTLKHAEPRVRRDAVAALGKIGGARAFALVHECLGDPETADVAMRCLGTIDRPRTVATFLEMAGRVDLLGRRNRRLREAIDALGELGAIESVQRLKIILMRGLWLPPSAGDTVRIAAARALQKIGTDDAYAALVGGTRLWRRPVRNVCAEILGAQDSGPR